MNPVLGWILGILGGILGLAVLLILAVLFLPTKLDVLYDDRGARIRLRFLFLRIPLFPKKKDRKSAKKEPSTPTVNDSPHEAQKPTEAPANPVPATEPAVKTAPVRESVKQKATEALKSFTFRDYITILKTFSERFLSEFTCESLLLRIKVGGEDAMVTALEYAQIQAALCPVLSVLTASEKLKKADVQIDPDFTSDRIRGAGRVVFSTQLYHSISFVTHLYKNLFG